MSAVHELVLVIDHPTGLHLRPAALFVKTAARFESRIMISNLDRVGRPEQSRADNDIRRKRA